MPKRVNRKFAVRVASLLVVITLAVAASASGQQTTSAAAVSHGVLQGFSQGRAATFAAAPPFAGSLDAIPEPASVGLLLMGVFMVVGRRHRSAV